MWGLTLADLPMLAGTIATLIVLEGLLSADNALVLAVMVRHLPKDQQKRALRYGIWGAFFFRAVAVIIATELIQYWELKVVGGLYLIYLTVKHFAVGESHESDRIGEDGKIRFGSGFWGTVISVELADIAFSIDSILAAVAMVQGLPEKLQQNIYVEMGIIYTGGVLGIIMMRMVAGVFLTVLNRYQGLAAGAYFLVAWIGLKLLGGGVEQAFDGLPKRGIDPGEWAQSLPEWVHAIPFEMPDWLFWMGMATIIITSLLYKPRPAEAPPEVEVPAALGGDPETSDPNDSDPATATDESTESQTSGDS